MATSAARDGYRVTGLREVVRALEKVGVDIQDLKDVFAEIADRGARAVEAHVPRKTGRLAGDVRGNRAKSKAVVAAGRSSVPYAGPINYGWPDRNIAPAEFMQRGEADLEPVAIQLLEDGVNNKIKEQHFR